MIHDYDDDSIKWTILFLLVAMHADLLKRPGLSLTRVQLSTAAIGFFPVPRLYFSAASFANESTPGWRRASPLIRARV